MINITDKEKCCGCTACYSVCPKNCISMEPDEEGFLYPKVDESICVHCELCEKVCPVLAPPQLSDKYVNCIVAQNIDDKVLDESTSGGFIDALYEYVLQELNGYGIGVSYNALFMPEHIITNSYDQAKNFRNSKYAQSDLNNVFSRIKQFVQRDKWVVFVGTPCQVAGLKSFLQAEYSTLVTVDLVCRSIPSPKLWKKYLLWQKEKYHSEIKSVSCRKKTYGYNSGTLEIKFANGKRYTGSNRVDYYMKAFHHDICSRPVCYACPFKTQHRCSDFTVFDCWFPEKVAIEPIVDNDRGYSNVIVHSEKGHILLQSIPSVRLSKANLEVMFKFTGGMESHSIEKKKERNTFYKSLDCVGFIKNSKKYVNVNMMDLIVESLKPLRYYFKKKKL